METSGIGTEDREVRVIDNPEQTMALLARLEAALPHPAIVPPELAAALRKQTTDVVVPERVTIVKVHYLGDPGGIMCALDLGDETYKNATIVSITHLRFDRRLPLARAILQYQKHRYKNICQQA